MNQMANPAGSASEPERSDVEDIFRTFATNNDKVEPKMAVEAIRALGQNPTGEELRRCGVLGLKAPVDFSTFYPMFQAVCRMREQLTPVEKANFSQEGLVAGFRVFDRDDSGLIHSSELRRLLTCIGDRMTEDEVELLLAGHTDQDGNVNYDEQRIDFATFVPIYQTLQKNREQTSMDELVQGFRVFDKEQNGLIRAAELRHLLTSLGEKLRDDEVEQLLSGLEDSQGNINYEDFVKNILNG